MVNQLDRLNTSEHLELQFIDKKAIPSDLFSETLDRIKADRDSAVGRSKQLLRLFEKELRDTELNLRKCLNACSVREHNVAIEFHAQVGLPPGFYLWDARMEVGARMLRQTNFSVELISIHMGFSSAKAFSRSFKRWMGLSPSIYRENVKKVIATIDEPSEDFNSIKLLRKVLTGDLSIDQALEFFDRLQAIRETSPTDPEPNPASPSDRECCELLWAEEFWETIRDRPYRAQRQLVRFQLHFETPALFDLLRHKSLEQGRVNHRRGIELAHLGIDSLEGCAAALGDDLPNKRAQGWICLANAYWLADDFAKAERSFCTAELNLDHAGSHRDPLVEAELLGKKANLRWFEGRYEEALDLVGNAIQVFDTAGEQVLLAQCLILKGCIKQDTGDPQGAIGDLRKALGYITEKRHPDICLSAQSALAVGYRLAGEYEEAERAIAGASALCERLDEPVKAHQLRWSDGLLKQAQAHYELAEQQLEEARSGLSELGELGYTGVVSLDLALLYFEEGRATEATEVATQALPILQAHMKHSEQLTALKMISDAIATQDVSLDLLRKIRIYLGIIYGEPPVRATFEEIRNK